MRRFVEPYESLDRTHVRQTGRLPRRLARARQCRLQQRDDADRCGKFDQRETM